MSQINHSASFAERYENSIHHHQQHWSNTKTPQIRTIFEMEQIQLKIIKRMVPTSLPNSIFLQYIHLSKTSSNQILNDLSKNQCKSIETSSIQNQQLHLHQTLFYELKTSIKIHQCERSHQNIFIECCFGIILSN
jgi:hypothetical protein